MSSFGTACNISRRAGKRLAGRTDGVTVRLPFIGSTQQNTFRHESRRINQYRVWFQLVERNTARLRDVDFLKFHRLAHVNQRCRQLGCKLLCISAGEIFFMTNPASMSARPAPARPLLSARRRSFATRVASPSVWIADPQIMFQSHISFVF